MSDFIFVFALPFILFGVALGFYYLVHALTVLAVARWNRRHKKEKDR